MITGTRFLSTLSRAAIALVAAEIAIAVALAATGSIRHRDQQRTREFNRLVVRELGLTDLALSSGTGYTRHPSQADLFAPHNEHPAALEHFPAGSVLPPPADRPGFSPSDSKGAAP